LILPLDRLATYPGVLAWYLLGSAATDQLRPESDIDLALLPLPGVDFDHSELIRWGGELSLILGRVVDIGVLDQRNLVYAKEALLKGRRLYCADEELATRRTSDLLALYLHFQEDRKEVLDAYRA